ncbi:hypothetical protein U9R90_09400 [Streptomyces sp. E11-3]|uniref:hypothetical protein n=1 Tax=Streptomyces sp. E11-3 TaxID=3110112 RepID=UPI0039813DEB
MSLSYQDVMTADLSPLSDVSEAWQKMGERFGDLKGDYTKHVQGALANGKWQGGAFGTHQDTSKATVFEYLAAKKEALAIASLLKEAYTELTRLQRAVKDLVADAEEKDYKVDSSGKATYVGFDNLSAQQRYTASHDPDHAKAVALSRQRAQEWTDEIAKAVKAVDDVDQSVKRALTRTATDTRPDGTGFGGFNAHAVGDLKKAGVPDEPEASETATQTNGWVAEGKTTVTGPAAGASVTGPGYGREGMAKAYADLGHATAEGSLTNGNMKLSGIADAYAGARATASIGITDKGIDGSAEASVGARAMAEGRAEYRHVGVYQRVTGFAGAEAGVNAGVGLEGVNLGAKAFAGAKVASGTGVEVAGIGIGGTAEGHLGKGAEAELIFGKGEDGKFHIGGKLGLSPGIGGALGGELTVDPDKVADAAGDAAEAVGDAAGAVSDKVGDAAGAAADKVGDAAGAAADTVGGAAGGLKGAVDYLF